MELEEFGLRGGGGMHPFPMSPALRVVSLMGRVKRWIIASCDWPEKKPWGGGIAMVCDWLTGGGVYMFTDD